MEMRSSKAKGDGRQESQIGHDKSRSLNVIKEAAKQTEKTKVESSQERTQKSDGESSSTHDTEKEVQKSQMYQEGLDMTRSARQDIFNDNLSVEELAKQVKMIANWLEKHQICLPERAKTCLNKIWKDFNNKSFYDQCIKSLKLGNYEYVKSSMSKNTEKVKKHMRDFLWEVEDLLSEAKKLEKVKEQTCGLEDAINLIASHREEFQRIGYDYKQFDDIQQKIENSKNYILKSKYFSIEEEAYFKAYCETVFKMSKDLESFLKIDADLERKKVLERENHIQELLEALPKVRPALSNLPREQWWKLYIDAPMHEKAQKDSNPGHFFDQDRSPGYQQSMLNLFEKVLVPAQNRNSKSMNYEDYTEIHKVATEYIPGDSAKKRMRQSGGIEVSRPYREVLGSRYGLANVGDEGMYERLAALQELQEERINGLPLLQNWKSTKHDSKDRIEDLYRHGPCAIAVSWVDQTCKVYESAYSCSYKIGNGEIEIIMNYQKGDAPRHVNAILARYYQARARPDRDERQKLTDIAQTVRALHVMHPKGDGNGRTHIFGLMNKWLIEEGFPPAILPNGPGVFGGLKTLDGLVEDMLEGMHAFVNAVEESRKEARARSSSPKLQEIASDRSRSRSTRG